MVAFIVRKVKFYASQPQVPRSHRRGIAPAARSFRDAAGARSENAVKHWDFTPVQAAFVQ
jgi:hypothetical protein